MPPPVRANVNAVLERRRRRRVPLARPVLVLRPQGTVSGVTIDVSCAGFCFLVRERFTAGEALTCRLDIGPHGTSKRSPLPAVALECEVHVVWRKKTAGGFRTGCQIDSYRVRTGG